MKIKMELLSDTIFGNGVSVPGDEDISVLTDMYGFPYFRGVTLKGIFREELGRYLKWTDKSDCLIPELLGEAGKEESSSGSLRFSDLVLSDNVRHNVLRELGANNNTAVTACVTHTRTFTGIENGTIKNGSLRVARCVNKGLFFYGHIECDPKDADLVKEVLHLIKYVGTMRNRGFGKVAISIVE